MNTNGVGLERASRSGGKNRTLYEKTTRKDIRRQSERTVGEGSMGEKKPAACKKGTSFI